MSPRLVFLFIVTLVSASTSSAHAQNTFKVMSLNLWLSGTAAHEVATGTVVGPSRAIPLFASFVDARMGTSAGLIALQEVDVNTSRCNLHTPTGIANRLGSGWWQRFGQARVFGGGAYGNAVLSNVTLAATEQYWPFAFDPVKGANCKRDRNAGMTDPESCDYGTEPRQATATKLSFGSGRALWFVAVHLDYHARVPTEQQLFELLGKTKGFDPDFPVIIAGDFNIPERGSEHEAAIQTMELGGYTLVGTSSVDYVFLYDPNNRIDVVKTSIVAPVQGGVKLSDHDAVIVDFKWNI
jgi:hypothetical protein